MLLKSNVLILDDPTNHLDLESISSLNDGLKAFKESIIFASHDHEFIQTLANHIIVISKNAKDEGNRMSILFTTDHNSGSLAKVINAIAKHGFNMENIKSRAIHNQPWKYYFYVEVEGSHQDAEAFALFADFERYCQEFKYLGTYTKKDY